MEDPSTVESSMNKSGYFVPAVLYNNPVTTSIIAIVVSILWWRSQKQSLISPHSSSISKKNEHHGTTNQSNENNSSKHDSTDYIIHGPNSIQTMVYQVTTPPLSKKNIPVFASAQSLQYNSNIYQTIELHLEHLYLEQIYHVHGNSSSSNSGGSNSITNPGPSNVCSDNIKQAGDNIASINIGGIKTENMDHANIVDQTRDYHDSINNNANNNNKIVIKKKKKKKSIVIPINAIINVTAQSPNNLATLILTINTKLVDQFQRDERNHSNNTDSIGGDQQNKKNGSTSTASNTINNNAGISTPYYNLVHNQVTIENWKTHHDLSHNEESYSINDYVIESDMNSYAENSSDKEDYNEESEILDDFNVDNEEEEKEEDVASTIQNDDILSKFTLGKIQTGSSHDNDTQSRLHDDPLTLKSINNRKKNLRSTHQKKSKRKRNHTLHNYNESDLMEKEFTFASYQEAASFQTAFLAMRTVGKEIRNMYSALEAIHLDVGSSQIGSSTPHRDTDHHDENADQAQQDENNAMANFLSPRHFGIQRYHNVGVHLLDVQHCLGEIPYIVRKISNYHLSGHRRGSSTPTDTALGHNVSNHSKRHASKQIKLGYNDFFRLLVPSTFIGTPYCSPAALEGIRDGIEAHQVRANELIQLRERVSAVALRVCAYVNAMEVVHEGWNIECDDLLSSSTSENEDLKKRFAFDQEWLNSQHDQAVRNEYYEPLGEKVIRRIAESENDSFMFQAYSLVNCHFVKYDKEATNQINGNSRLHPMNDPAMAIPSLKKLLKKHPAKQFFICSYFHENSSTASIMLFVRNLAELDADFDDKLKDLIHGQENTYSGLELSTHIGEFYQVLFDDDSLTHIQ